MIIVELIGGLGNQMFQYAIGRSIAIKNNDVLKIDITRFENYQLHDGYRLDAFNVNYELAALHEINSIVSKNRILRKFATIGIYNRKKGIFCVEKLRNETKFDQKIFSYKDLYLSGYWQNEKYFLDIREILLKEFTLKNAIGKRAAEYMNLIKNTNSVGVHIRRGDYLALDWFVGIEYYEKSLEYANMQIANPSFFIFSDDIEWCKKNFDFMQNVTYVEKTDSELEDLELMKNAKHNIIANSSFSWWAAWLNTNRDKIVIAPKIWFKSRDGFDPVPESWIKL